MILTSPTAPFRSLHPWPLLPGGRKQAVSRAFAFSTTPGSLPDAAEVIAPVHSSEHDTLPRSTLWAVAIPPDQKWISTLTFKRFHRDGTSEFLQPGLAS